jgi:ryanodine receptor 2
LCKLSENPLLFVIKIYFVFFLKGFSLNGELLMDALGGETSFADVHAEGVGFVPACTLGVGQKARLTYGQDVDSLKFFTTCGLQEGYEPFCV